MSRTIAWKDTAILIQWFSGGNNTYDSQDLLTGYATLHTGIHASA